MAIVKTDDQHYKAIADEIRYGWNLAYDDNTNMKMRPSDMAITLQYVIDDCYWRGYTNGYETGEQDGILVGKQAEYDAFWDVFQNNGDAAGVNYYYAFAYSDRFTDENYNPKYDIICASGNSPAMALFYSNKVITDTKVPIRVLGASIQSAFYGCTNLRTIPLLEVHDDVVFASTFGACSALEEINIEGVIGKDINFAACKKLTGSSLLSIMSALSDTASGCTVTFSATAHYDASLNLGSEFDEAWQNLVDSKSNWTIAWMD